MEFQSASLNVQFFFFGLKHICWFYFTSILRIIKLKKKIIVSEIVLSQGFSNTMTIITDKFDFSSN